MTPIPALELAKILGGVLKAEPKLLVAGFVTDHREAAAAQGAGFLAIRGARVDGHDFAAAAIAQGASVVIAEKPVDAPHILVPDLVQALARLGAHYRSKFHGPVIGITGSAGKTTTKEFAAAALSPLGPVLKTRGNRNTEYTAPLVWTELADGTAAAVIEMSMRGPGQIAHLAGISRPTIGLITNIGFAHLETVGSRDALAEAKGELIRALPEWAPIILWSGDPYYRALSEMSAGPVKSFGFQELSDCWLQSYTALGWDRSRITGYVEGQPFEVELPVVGRHLALNAAAGLLAAVLAGSPPSPAAAALAHAELPPMRMEVREVRGVRILLDSYNASPPSMVAAVETLAELPAERRFAVIGEMKELGSYSDEGHREVGRALAQAALDDVLFYGPATISAREEAGLGRMADSLDDVRLFLGGLKEGDAVLIKGSRALELERALEGLE